MRGTGLRLVGDLVVGIIGAFIGGWLLPRVGVHLGAGIIGAIFDATIGAIVLLLVVRLVRGGSASDGYGWGRLSGSRRYARETARGAGPMSLIVWILLGLAAGPMASKTVSTNREGTIVDIPLGIVGAVIGDLLFNLLGRGRRLQHGQRLQRRPSPPRAARLLPSRCITSFYVAVCCET